MDNRHFRRELEVDVSAEKLAEWHEGPGAFGRIQPPWESAKIVKKAQEIKDGLEEHIQIKIGLINKMWIARYHDVIKGEQFCDLQVSGPFEYWDHRHIFVKDGENKAKLIDEISYREPLGWFGRFIAGKMVAGKLAKMFRYRHVVTKEDLERYYGANCLARKGGKILIAGGSGFVGSSLESLLKNLGYEVFILTRRAKKNHHIAWNPDKGEIDVEKMEGMRVIINLSGRNIAAPWTKKVKRELRESRLKSTALLVDSIKKLSRKPELFISASGSSVYPLHDGREYDESGEYGNGFLPELAREWEGLTLPLEEMGVRRLVLRIGLVLSPAGGALQKMLPAFKLGLGGPFGDGKQYMSWIQLNDLLDIMAMAIEDERYCGVMNAVSPEPVTNLEFCQTLGSVLRRPCFMKVPAFVLKMIPGGMGREIFLASNRVKPKRLIDVGFKFRSSNLKEALKHLLGAV